jgi:hypothetical protein
MTPWIIGGVVVIVIIGIAWARVHSARSERRSMETYGHGLAVLGDVAKRTSSPSASVRVLPRSEAGRGHVRTNMPPDRDAVPQDTRPPSDRQEGRAAGQERVDQPAARRPPTRSVPLRQRPSASIPVPEDLSFEDRGEEWAGAARPSIREPAERAAPPPPGMARMRTESPDASTGAFATRQPSISPDELRRQATMRKLGVGGGKPAATAAKHHHTTTPTTPTSTTVAKTTTTTTPVVSPVSVDGNELTFNAPSGHYTLTFQGGGGACWVGVETGLDSGTYLYSDTVEPGTTASYKASGPLAVALGAPYYLSVLVNGVPVKIPKGVTANNLVFAAG